MVCDQVFIGIGMVMSVLWIYFIANELVSLLNVRSFGFATLSHHTAHRSGFPQSAGVILRISSTIMGLTILAWGNSVGDTISNIVVARHGQPQMAIGACFAAPLTSTA
jgi:sodium/potassium/calcium exchanger 6